MAVVTLQEFRLFSSAKNGCHRYKIDEKRTKALVQRRQHGPHPFSGCKTYLRRLNGDEHLLLIYHWLNRRKYIKNIILISHAWVKPTNT